MTGIECGFMSTSVKRLNCCNRWYDWDRVAFSQSRVKKTESRVTSRFLPFIGRKMVNVGKNKKGNDVIKFYQKMKLLSKEIKVVSKINESRVKKKDKPF